MSGTNFYSVVNGTTGVHISNQSGLGLLGSCTGVPDTSANQYAAGCLMVRTDTTGKSVYQNVGTAASPSWSLLDTASASLVLPTSATDSSTTTGDSLSITTSAITTGNGLLVTGSGASLASAGSVARFNGGANTDGAVVNVTSTGVYTGTVGILSVIANSVQTGRVVNFSGAGLTTGAVCTFVATAATLTSGFYIRCNDGAVNVLTIGANGHIQTNQTTAPTIALTTANGISAPAITAGSTDVCGIITTSGTSTGGTQLTVTFNKTYTTAPKTVFIAPANASAANPNTQWYVDNITATTFRVTVGTGGTHGTAPSFFYWVIG